MLKRDAKGRERWRLLGWRMTQAEAQQWAASNMNLLEVVPGSGEKRGPPMEVVPSGKMMKAPGF